MQFMVFVSGEILNKNNKYVCQKVSGNAYVSVKNYPCKQHG